MFRGRVPKAQPIGVLSKVLRILELLDSAPVGLTLKDISSQAQISKSTAFRLLAHLESAGYLFRDDSGAYAAGPKLLRFGFGPSQQIVLRKIGRPFLQDLRDATRETVNLGILVGHEVFYVDVLQSPDPFPMASRIGMFRPLYCTAMGKALASTLASTERDLLFSSLRFFHFTPKTITATPKFKQEILRIQSQGYAFDDEEAALGARCVSVPVITCCGKLAAAVSVSAPVRRMQPDKIPSVVQAVRDAAQAFAESLAASGLRVQPHPCGTC